MTKEQLRRKIARLETLNDHLYTELVYLDELMKAVGFMGGIATVRQTAHEMLSQGAALAEEEEGEEE